MRQETILQSDGREMNYYVWLAEPEEAVLQVVEGASEQALRYREFAEWMQQRGVSVYAMDNRGHGRNRDVEGYVHIDHKNWHQLVDDVISLGEKIRRDRGKKPFLLGHSMGSFISRCVALEGADYETFIFTGSGWQDEPVLLAAMKLAEILMKIHGEHDQNEFFEHISFDSYRRIMLKKGLTTSSYGWLTRDEEKLKEAEAEPSLKERFSLGAHRSLLQLVKASQDLTKVKNISAPVYFLSGSLDPVGDFSKGVRKAYTAYRKRALVPVNCYFYEGMHHEILNEKGREEVYQDILYFIRRSP